MGQDMNVQCQWPNVVVPVIWAAVGLLKGIDIIRQLGYTGEFLDNFKGYMQWLERWHVRQVWGENMSNAMVVFIKIVLQLSRED